MSTGQHLASDAVPGQPAAPPGDWSNPGDHWLRHPPEVASALLAERLTAAAVVVTHADGEQVTGEVRKRAKRRSKLWLLMLLPCTFLPMFNVVVLLAVVVYLVRSLAAFEEPIPFTLRLRPQGEGTRVVPADPDVLDSTVGRELRRLAAESGTERQALSARLFTGPVRIGWARPAVACPPRPVMAGVGVPRLRRSPTSWNGQLLAVAAVATCMLLYAIWVYFLFLEHQPEVTDRQAQLVAYTLGPIFGALAWPALRTYRWGRGWVIPTACAAAVIALCTYIVHGTPFYGTAIVLWAAPAVIALLLSRAAPGRAALRFTSEWQRASDHAKDAHAAALAAWASAAAARPVPAPAKPVFVFGGEPASWDLLVTTVGSAVLGGGGRLAVVRLGPADCAATLAELAAGRGVPVRHSGPALPPGGTVGGPQLEIIELTSAPDGMPAALISHTAAASWLVVAGAERLEPGQVRWLLATRRPEAGLMLLFTRPERETLELAASTAAAVGFLRMRDQGQAELAAGFAGPVAVAAGPLLADVAVSEPGPGLPPWPVPTRQAVDARLLCALDPADMVVVDLAADATRQASCVGLDPVLSWAPGPPPPTAAARARVGRPGTLVQQVAAVAAAAGVVLFAAVWFEPVPPYAGPPQSPRLVLSLPEYRGAFGIALSPDGSTVAGGSSDGRAYLWDIATRRRTELTSPATSSVNNVDFSPDGQTLAGGTSAGEVVLWNVASGRSSVIMKRPPNDYTLSEVAFSPDGTILAVATQEGNIRVWDVSAAKIIALLPDAQRDAWATGLQAIAFSPDGRTLAAGYVDGSVVLWDPRQASVVARLADPGRPPGTPSGWQPAIAYNRDGSILAASAPAGGIRLWDRATGKVLSTLPRPEWNGISGLGFSPDGRTLVAADSEGAVVFWEFVDGKQLGTIPARLRFVTELLFTSDGSTMIFSAASDTYDYEHVHLWDMGWLGR